MTEDTPGGGTAIDPKALRRCLGSFATGVAVVTTRQGDRDIGVTVNSFTSLSLDPPLVLWCLARTSRTYSAFSAADYFTVNILAVDQVTVSNRFAFRSDEEFPIDVPFSRGIADTPVLDGVCSHFQCRRTDVFDGGDHVVVVGEVLDFAGYDRPGLVYRVGQYAVADAHPSVFSQSLDSLDNGFLDATVRPALEGLIRRFESFFDEQLRDAGVSSKESQVLGLLVTHGALSAEEIANRGLVSGSFLEETLESLEEKELIATQSGGYVPTASGQALASDWFETLRSHRAKAIGTIAPGEADGLRRTLARLSEWVDEASSGPPSS